MLLKKIRLIRSIAIISSLLTMPVLVNAGDLKISNDSKYDLSFSINNTCSEEFGVVSNRTMKVIPERSFNKACEYNQGNCETKVYNATACSGKQVAVVVFNTHYGVQGLYPTDIITKGNGFNLFFEGPWQAKLNSK